MPRLYVNGNEPLVSKFTVMLEIQAAPMGNWFRMLRENAII